MNTRLASICFCTIISYACAQNPEVQTANGRVRGYEESVFGQTIHTYQGIPFAKPPIGNLRFKRPEPVENWSGVINATSWHKSCHQVPFTTFYGKVGEAGEALWNAKPPLSEDCLFLNMWIPRGKNPGRLSTMVWIFGGGFYYGSAALPLYNGKYLAAYANVLVVSINYRVGPLGFLYFGNDDAPGNMGLLDQSEALKWISANINAFGGSADDVTIFGESAGAASVSYHVMSELSEPYFQRAIMQSGTSLSNWAHVSPKTALTYARQFSALMNCSGSDATKLKCLMNADPQTISRVQWSLPITALAFPVAPTTDNYFIKESPMEFIENGRFVNKSLLFGVDLDESVFFLLYWVVGSIDYPNLSFNRSQFLKTIPATVSDTAIDMLSVKDDSALIDAILQQYEAQYIPASSRKYMDLLDDIGGDFSFKCPVVKFAQSFAKTRQGSPPVFMYSFEHRTSTNPWPEWAGVLHGDEIEYIFGVPVMPLSGRNAEEKELSYSMMEYWTNFAKYGNPMTGNGKNRGTIWPEYTYTGQEYIVLKGDTIFETRRGLRHQQCAFWTEYYPKLRKTLEKKKYTDCISGGNDLILSSTCLVSVIFLHFWTR